MKCEIDEKASESTSEKIRTAFLDYPNWNKSENELRELRKKVLFAVYAVIDDMDRATDIVEDLINLLLRADKA